MSRPVRHRLTERIPKIQMGKRKETIDFEKEVRSCRAQILKLRAGNASLAEERDYFKSIFESANDGIIIHDEDGRILEVNDTYCRRLGYDKEEMLNMTLSDLVPAEYERDHPRRAEPLWERGNAIFESRNRRRDGTVMPVEVSATRIDFHGRKAVQSVVRDILNIRLAEELIGETMEDNARLRAEIRRQTRFATKSFSEILKSLAAAFGRRGREAEVEAILARQSVRIANIDFVQTLHYRLPAAGMIDIGISIRKLIPFNFQRFGVNPCRISTEIGTDGIFLDLSRSVICCQLIAEFLVNSLQHAFPGNRPGVIGIRLTRGARGGYVLAFADNGKGISKDFRLGKARTLGMRLVLDLVGQLGGSIELRRNRGTKFIVRFG